MAETTALWRLTEEEAREALEAGAQNILFIQGRRTYRGGFSGFPEKGSDRFRFSGVEVGGKERITYSGRATYFFRA